MAKVKINIDELVSSIGGAFVLLGKRDRCVSAASPIDEADSDAVTFCNKKFPESLQMIRNTRAGVVICPDDLSFTEDDIRDRTLILVSDPRLAFMRIMRRHFANQGPTGCMSSAAVIDEAARIHPSVCIGPNSYIGACEIGDNSVIYGNAYIYSGTVIGKNVVIHAGVVIGSEGQGFHRNESGELEKFPQIGGVVIEDDVEIGSNTSINRGAMGNTVVGQGTKIGHLCSIAHGVTIGKHCIIASHSMLGGSSKIGDYCQVSLAGRIRNGARVGRNVLVGLGAIVTSDVGDNKIVYGVPAKEHGEIQGWIAMD